MQVIQNYLYDNVVVVQFPDTSANYTRNRNVYTRTIRLHRGIDNKLRLDVMNQDQKHLNITGMMLTVDIVDTDISASVYRVNATPLNANIGRALITIDKNTLSSLTKRFYKLTIQNSGSLTYVSDNYQVQLDVEVVDGYHDVTSDTIVASYDMGRIVDPVTEITDLGSL